MAKREGLRKEIIERLSAAITEKILQMDIGSADSIGHLASEYFRALGYESRHLGIDLGYCWTKDGGKTYAIKEMDLFEACRFATCCSAKTVCKTGGQPAMPTLDEVMEIYKGENT